jgi:capsular polysaccharide biosynthesis protein
LIDLSVAEQIDLFADADLIVAPHGAGLSNVVYADAVAVIELFGQKKMASFARLAEMLGHDYTYLECAERGVHLVVDPTELERAIEAAISRRA